MGASAAHSSLEVAPRARVKKGIPAPERTMYVRERLFLGGGWVDPASGQTLPVLSPASEAEIGRYPRATLEDADRAVAAARRAFDEGPWPRMSPAERSDVLLAMAEHLRARRRELAELSIDEAGVPLFFAHARENGPIA